MFVVRLAADRYSGQQRDQLLNRMTQRGIQVNNYFPPVYLQPFIAAELGHKPGDFPVTDLGAGDHALAVPQQSDARAGLAGLSGAAKLLR